MKITKKYLRQIIQEEIRNVSETDWRDTASEDYHAPQSEVGPYSQDATDAIVAAVDGNDEEGFYAAVDSLLAKGHTMEEIQQIVSSLGEK